MGRNLNREPTNSLTAKLGFINPPTKSYNSFWNKRRTN